MLTSSTNVVSAVKSTQTRRNFRYLKRCKKNTRKVLEVLRREDGNFPTKGFRTKRRTLFISFSGSERCYVSVSTYIYSGQGWGEGADMSVILEVVAEERGGVHSFLQYNAFILANVR